MILNMTPHDIKIVGDSGKVESIFPSNGLIRLSVQTVEIGHQDGVRLTKSEFGEPEGLPEFEAGTFYIVSQLVKAALPDRKDLLVPAEMVRDDKGQIIGCRSLGV